MSAMAIPRDLIEFWRVLVQIDGKWSCWEFQTEAQARSFKRQIEDEDPAAKARVQYGFND